MSLCTQIDLYSYNAQHICKHNIYNMYLFICTQQTCCNTFSQFSSYYFCHHHKSSKENPYIQKERLIECKKMHLHLCMLQTLYTLTWKSNDIRKNKFENGLVCCQHFLPGHFEYTLDLIPCIAIYTCTHTQHFTFINVNDLI